MIERAVKRHAKIAVFAVAHHTYFEQFEGLYQSLEVFHSDFKELIAKNDVEISDFGILDSNAAAYRALDGIRAANVDLVICNMITYATSSVFAPILRDCPAPLILAALQPRSALDYEKANTFAQLQNDNICSVPEFMYTANRMGKRIHDIIIGQLYGDEDAERALREWCDIAKVLNSLKGARMGLMGHTMEAMYDMHADPTSLSAAFGLHIPLIEIESAVECYESVTEEEITAKYAVIDTEFEQPDPKSDPITRKLTDEDKYVAARGSCALDRFIKKHELTGLAYYYEGRPDTIQRRVATSFIVGNSMLNAQGFPMCGEYDIKTCIAMLILDRLDIGGSFAELHPFDFAGDFILIGHDGPHHIKIANGKPILRSLTKFHGKPGSGASIEFKIKEGPITLLGITQNADGKYKFVIGEGISKEGPIPPTGNTNTRAYFEGGTKEYIKKWCLACPTHHFALGVGHKADTIAKIAQVLGIDYTIIK